MSKGLTIMLVSAVVLILLLVGAGFYLIWTKVSALDQAGADTAQEETAAAEEEKKMGPVYTLDTFIVNLADKGGKRYLRTSMELELKDEEVNEKIETRLPQVKDAILMILPTKTMANVNNTAGKNALREELMSSLNGFLGPESVTYIYFTEFVIQ